jgi:hypothetical protein
MTFSEEDSATIDRIRRREHDWRTYRWIVLAFGLIQVGVALYLFFWARAKAEVWGGKLGDYTPIGMFELAVLGTKIEALFVTGIVTLLFAWRRWRGNPDRLLLLSIVDRIAKGKALTP